MENQAGIMKTRTASLTETSFILTVAIQLQFNFVHFCEIHFSVQVYINQNMTFYLVFNFFMKIYLWKPIECHKVCENGDYFHAIKKHKLSL